MNRSNGETRTGADLFVEALSEYGVDYVFGNPGTTELPVMDALEGSDIEYVLGLHEDVAVGAAAGYASTRRYHAHRDPDVLPAGVVNLHVAPGLAHGLGNLYNAARAGVPLVVTAGEAETDHLPEEPILSGDLERMAGQFTKWADEVPSADALPGMLRRAVRVALTPPTGPVFLALPLNAMLGETGAEPERLGAIPDAGRGDPDAIDRAADLLVEADEPAMIVGDHVARAGSDAVDAAVALAEASGARVHGELFASEIGFPTDHDQWVSFLPPVESIASRFLDADTLVFAGCWSNTTATEPATDLVPEDAACIHLGDDAWELGKNQPADAAVVGDPARVMAAVAERVGERLPSDARESRIERVHGVREATREKMAGIGSGDPDDPRASKAELADALRRAAPDALVVDESITASLVLLNRGTFGWGDFVSGKGGGLGYGLPAAMGAAMATDRDVIGFVGDGSYLYYPHALYTAARYGIDLTVVIPDNRNYRILKDNMLSLMGGEEDDYEFVGMDFDPPVDIPANAESVGARGELVDESDPDALAAAIGDAVAEDGPVVLDVPVQD